MPARRAELQCNCWVVDATGAMWPRRFLGICEAGQAGHLVAAFLFFPFLCVVSRLIAYCCYCSSSFSPSASEFLLDFYCSPDRFSSSSATHLQLGASRAAVCPASACLISAPQRPCPTQYSVAGRLALGPSIFFSFFVVSSIVYQTSRHQSPVFQHLIGRRHDCQNTTLACCEGSHSG